VVCAWKGDLRRLPRGRALLLCAGGGAALVANWWLIFSAFSYTSISVATVVYHTQPFLYAAMGAALLREETEPRRWMFMLVAFAGVVAIVQGRPAGTDSGHFFTGVAMALGAAVFWALAALAAKRLTGVPPHVIALVQCAAGVLLVAPFARLLPSPVDPGTWFFFAGIGVFYTGFVFTLIYGAVQKLSTTAAGTLSFVYPVVALAVDRVAFGQVLSAVQWLGVALVLAAMLLAARRAG
jgi:drug/metabolite transporter (DMT)-like permease